MSWFGNKFFEIIFTGYFILARIVTLPLIPFYKKVRE